MLRRAALAALVVMHAAGPASAQFYKDKTLTLLINYGAGGNADTEARVFQQHLKKHIAGPPSIIIQNLPGAGGLNAINQLGLNVGSKPDGLTMGYFTFSPTPSMTDDPALKVNVAEFVVIAASRSNSVAYGRKDIPPGLSRPTDLVKATKVFVGGYARPSMHDTRLRLSLEILGVPYTMVTGFQTTAAINKAMLQGELHLSGSTLPGYQTQAIPQLINTGVAIPLWQYPIMDRSGRPVGNAQLDREGLPTFDKFYEQAFGKPLSDPKWRAMLIANTFSSQMQRLAVLPKGSPVEAAAALREAFKAVANDKDFIADFKKITNEEPEIVHAEEIAPLLKQLREVDPAIKQVLKESIAEPR